MSNLNPQRKCIGCGTVKDKKELIRIVFDGENLLVDKQQNIDGRACYLCNTDKCLELAIKKNAFKRSLKQNISSEHIGRCFNDR